MNVYEETQLILHKYKIQANKSLGQNFLVDDNVIDEIIRSSNINKQDLIIEIGPGLGVLTNRLLQEANNIIAVELDKRMVNILQDRFILNINDQAESKLEIINEDILKINLNEIIAEKRKQTEIKNVKIVANLPYYISTPIIMKLLENRLDIDEIIVMVQKEVAERLTAKTGTRLAGAITYAVEYYSDATSIIKVPKESFVPSPKVESEVIKLKVRKGKKIQVKDEKLLFNIISKSFMQRRKTLSNVLINNNIMHSKEDVKNIVDFGTNNAAIPLLLSKRTLKKIIGIEIQDEAVDLARRNVEMNDLNDQIEIVHGDIKDVVKELPKAQLIVCNPPFFEVGENSNLNDNEYLTIARHEIKIDLEGIISAAAYLLDNKGRFAIVHRPDRMIDILNIMQKYDIEPKRIRFVYPKMNRDSHVLLVEGMYKGKKGLKIEPPLYAHNDDGSYSNEVRRMFGEKIDE